MDERRLLRQYWMGQIHVWFKHNGAGFGLVFGLVVFLGALMWMRNSNRRDQPTAMIVVTVPDGYTGVVKIVVDKHRSVMVPDKGGISLRADAGVVRVPSFARFVRVAPETSAVLREPVDFVDEQDKLIPYGGARKTPYAVWYLDSDLESYEAFYVGTRDDMEAEQRRHPKHADATSEGAASRPNPSRTRGPRPTGP